MLNFNITKTLFEETVTYEISGYIDEKAIFPLITLKPKININLKNVTGLNSVGTRSWCQWVKQMTLPSMVFLDDCPMLFVKSFNQIVGALSANMTVNSFIVPYCSVNSDERKNKVYTRGQEIDNSGIKFFPEVKDSKGEVMELDVLNQYFNFLKK